METQSQLRLWLLRTFRVLTIVSMMSQENMPINAQPKTIQGWAAHYRKFFAVLRAKVGNPQAGRARGLENPSDVAKVFHDGLPLYKAYWQLESQVREELRALVWQIRIADKKRDEAEVESLLNRLAGFINASLKISHGMKRITNDDWRAFAWVVLKQADPFVTFEEPREKVIRLDGIAARSQPVRIARREAERWLKDEPHTGIAQEGEKSGLAPAEPVADPATPASVVEDEVIRRLEFLARLKQLSPGLKIIAILVAQGYSDAEVAQKLDKTPTAVWKARQRIRESGRLA